MQPIAGRSKPSVSTTQLVDDLGLAGRQSGKDCIAFGFGVDAIDVLGANTGFHEFVPDVHRMRNVDAEHQGLSALAVACASWKRYRRPDRSGSCDRRVG